MKKLIVTGVSAVAVFTATSHSVDFREIKHPSVTKKDELYCLDYATRSAGKMPISQRQRDQTPTPTQIFSKCLDRKLSEKDPNEGQRGYKVQIGSLAPFIIPLTPKK